MRALACLLAACGLSAGTGSKACAVCHSAIYDKFQRSGMARSSGPVGDGLEKFDHVSFRGGRVTPAFNVEFANGSFAMRFFIGSGAVGRSYAGFVDGFLFQSPASYFTSRHAWGLSPGYSTKAFVDVARPIESACLQCHASGARVAAGTENRYPDPPFAEGGVSCERCHGAGEGHRVINPAKLPAPRRDSVCLQCHLTGAARIAQPGRGPETFRPGDLLSEHVMVFVWSRDGGERTATDHAEQLARSRCQQASGHKLWCGTCHDAHAGSTRQTACLDCHQPHANGGAGCASCHMPKGRTREGEHVAFTSHLIEKQPGAPAKGARLLQPFQGMTASERDWALAQSNRPLLEKLAARPDADAAVLVQLAQLYDPAGKGAPLYERALRLEPSHSTALANLAIYRMQAGRAREALLMWSDVFARNPGMLSVGLNLAMGRLEVGDREGALATLDRLLRFHPDSAQARALRAKLR
jgi:hypothetical protein